MMLEKLCKVLPEVLCNHRPDCCILATRLALDVLHLFKIPANALSVKAIIYNAPLAKRMRERRTPRTMQELEKAFAEDGSYSVGLGYGYTEGKWSGHLVVISKGQMLDLTIGQASRPQHGLVLEPFVVPVNPAFLSGNEPLLLTCDGVVVRYGAFPADDSYEVAPDWTIFAWRDKLISETLRRL